MSSIGPPTGMRDWLPQDALLRQRLMETISSVYRLYGYLPIDTPAMEDLAVLLGKGGGENEKLLFKVLKRGDKLKQAMVGGDVADYGLRFDLTVPLARFVVTHQGESSYLSGGITLLLCGAPTAHRGGGSASSIN